MWAFEISDIYDKIDSVRKRSSDALAQIDVVKMPDRPARNESILPFKDHPPKLGLSKKSGQARLLHDLASIELQAMELGLRTLLEFPQAPEAFKEDLLELTLSESRHLEMCLIEMENLGHKWGDWPISCGLWETVSADNSLLDRIALVHRYLEGSGLDAGEVLLKRLNGVDAVGVQKAVKLITTEEVGHVLFGSDWYRKICQLEGVLDSEKDFMQRLNRFRHKLPVRINPIDQDVRKKAGFSFEEIKYLQDLRDSFLSENKTQKNQI